MCSKNKPLYPEYDFYRTAWNTYYRVKKNNPQDTFEFFKPHSNKWILIEDPPQGYASEKFIKNLIRVPDPKALYNCAKCNNKGCNTCSLIPWSICNVFKK